MIFVVIHRKRISIPLFLMIFMGSRADRGFPFRLDCSRCVSFRDAKRTHCFLRKVYPFAQESTIPGVGFAAVPGQKGGQDITGPYDVVTDWPKDIATLPGHSEWTFGAVRGVFAESPDRVFVLQVSEKPKVERPEPRNMPEVGASSVFPVDRLPWRSGRGPG